MPNTGNRTGEKGAQLNNNLATKSKIFKRRYKRNSSEGIAIQFVQDQLASAKGGYENLSPQEQLLIQRTAFTVVRVCLMEAEMIKAIRNKIEIPEWKDKIYLTWKSSLRSDLQLIGMERKVKEVESLQDYIKRKELEKSESQ